MAGPQKARTVKSRTRAGRRVEVRELIKELSMTNLEQLVEANPKGTSFKGELRRKCLIEIDRRLKNERALLVSKSKAGMKKPEPKLTVTIEESNNG